MPRYEVRYGIPGREYVDVITAMDAIDAEDYAYEAAEVVAGEAVLDPNAYSYTEEEWIDEGWDLKDYADAMHDEIYGSMFWEVVRKVRSSYGNGEE